MHTKLETRVFEVGSVQLEAVCAGPESGPLVILLHGFPEFWYGWRHQIGPLADAGFRVIVPDQRGYNNSSKPREVRAYTLRNLSADILAVADQLGHARFCLAGHDWGAAVAWTIAMRSPERLHRLGILNVPHPGAMLRYLRRHPRQLLRSWYMLFFQIPHLPEALLSARDYQLCRRTLIRTSRPGTFADEDLTRYREAWSKPGALTSMIHWYRALLRYPAETSLTVDVPTRILWGMQDRFLLPGLARESLRDCSSGELIEFPHATHWLQHEEPIRVAQLLVDFFGR